MRNPTYNKSIVEKFSIKGELSDDGKMIQFENSEKELEMKSVDDCFKPFRGQAVDITISMKSTQDLCEEE